MTNEVGLFYFHGSNVRKLPEINICPRTTIKLSVISIITRSSRWKIMESMTGIWLEDILLGQRFCTYGHADVKGRSWMERRQKIFLCKWRETELLFSYPILQKAGIPTSLYPDNAVYLFAPKDFGSRLVICY